MLLALHGAGPPLAIFAAWCGRPASAMPGLLFLTGLVGGLAHCGPMCGPFALAQAAGVGAEAPLLRRLAGGLLLPYHLGRLSTYAALGALAAALGLAVVRLGPVRLALALLLLGAALLFLLQALARLLPGPARGRTIPAGWADLLARLAAPLFAAPSPAARFALGAVLGLLPCGFLYGALAAAAATRSPLAGAAAMAAFGAGTAPSLMLLGLGGAGLAVRWRAAARRALAPLFLFDAAVLTAMAVVLAAAP
jgi:uncharacterized protein